MSIFLPVVCRQAPRRSDPIYTKPGENGGLFIREDYNPHINSLTPMELENLREMYEQTEGVHKKVLLQIIRKYGPDKLKL